MLSSRVGRHAIRRFNVSTSSILQRVELVPRVGTVSNSADLPIRSRPIDSIQLSGLRCFATEAVASKPKAHTGRTTTKKTATKTTTKKTATKAPKKKAAAKKKATKKPAKKAVKKPKAKKVKKVLTPEEKKKAKIRELKVKALSTPHGLPANAWLVLSAETTKRASEVTSGAKEASVKYKNLLPEERERYNHIANENKTKNEAAYKAWVEGFTPDQIRLANNARTQLRRLTGQARKWTSIKDDRQVKRPVNARIRFNSNRWASGDFNGMKITEVPALLSREWEGLSAAEKKSYDDQFQADKQQYLTESARLYPKSAPKPRVRRTTKDSTAAAAQLQRETNA